MSDTTSAPIGGIDQTQLQALINQLTGPQQAAPPSLPDSGPSSREGRGFLSLLGEALGGGQQYGSTADREQGGLSAAQAMGLRMLAASDYSVRPHTLGSIIAQGQLGARESLGQSQAVASARQQAAYDQARQAQQDQLARIKEAIPLLELKGKLAAVSATPATLDGDSGGGAGTYEGAIGGHEGTGKNPNSTAFGTGQFLASTWNEFAAANPDLFKGMTPEQILAARSNPDLGNKAINWLAQRNAGELANAGVTPSGQSLGMAHYLGSGPAAAIMKAADSAPVSQFVSAAAVKANPELGRMTVGDMKRRYANTPAPSFLRTAQPAPASPPGAPSPPGPMATPTPTRQPAPGPGNIPLPPGAAPPPSDTAGPGTTEPPMAPGAGAQVAGPGAPTAPGVAPTMPGTDATVAAIREGMVRSGANPDTLEPGPVPGMGGGQTTATAGPAAPPEPAPGSFEAYKKLHASELTPDPTTSGLFNPQPDADQLRVIQSQKRQAQLEYQQAHQAADLTGQSKAREKYIDAQTQENTMRENARKLGVETQRSWLEKQNDRLFQAWTADQKREADRQDEAQKQTNELARIVATGEQTRASAREALQNEASGKLIKDLNTESTAARDRIGALEATLELSKGVQDPTLLATKAIGGVPVVDLLKGLNIGSEAFQSRLSAIQALRSGIANVTKAMRQGVALGNASDADLRFITALGPSEMEDDSTREAIIGNLLGQQYRLMKFNTEVNKNIANGMKSGEAIDAANKTVPPVTPTLPKELQNAPRGDPEVAKWFELNVPPNTIWADADGRRHIYHSPGWQPPQGPAR